MSLCFSREMIPVCTPITLVTHPNKTPKLLSDGGGDERHRQHVLVQQDDGRRRGEVRQPVQNREHHAARAAIAAAPEAPMASRVKKSLRARRSTPRHAPVTRYARVRASREARVSFPRGTETRRDATGDGGGARFGREAGVRRCASGVRRRACALGAPRGGVRVKGGEPPDYAKRSVTPSLDEKSARFRFLTESAYKGLHVLNPEKERVLSHTRER